MNWKKGMVIFGICSSVLLSACSSEEENQGNYQDHTKHISNGDIREETLSKKQKPKFLADKPKEMQTIYLAVAEHQDLLENIPCYCGCGESVNHQNNYDCFVYENKPNEAIVWDDHGTKCGVCLETAAQAINELNKGKSIKEIRQEIDDKYKEGYPSPTKTPEV